MSAPAQWEAERENAARPPGLTRAQPLPMHAPVPASRSVLALAWLALAACGGAGGRCGQPRTPTPLDSATVGTISGTVTFGGPAPTMKQLSMTGDCALLHRGRPVLAGDALVDDGKVENAFVYLKEGLGDRVFAVPETAVTIDQAGCIYRPRVVGVQTCQPLVFVNSDPMLHNVHGTPQLSTAWNFSMGAQGSRRTLRLERPEVPVAVRCDVHPWMQAFVGVLDHPYFAVTTADGAFTLRDVPPGEYVVASWHERFGAREARVTLAAKGTQQVGLAYGPR